VPDSLIDLAGLRVGVDDFLAAVLSAAAQPIWVVDPDDVIRFANPAAIAALGYDRADQLLGRRSHDTIHHSRPDGTPYPAAECPMLLPRITGEPISSDLDWFFRRDGSIFPVSYVSVPIEMQEGRGAVVAFTDIEDRRRAERELREHDEILAAERASLRRVAALVAGGAASAEVFAAIAREVGQVIGLPMIALWRYGPDGTATVIGAWSEHPHPFEVGTRWPLDGPTICAKVLKTGSPARIEDFADIPGTIADAARRTGIGSCAGAPIIVDGKVWGAMSADSTEGAPLPDHIEDRLAEFTELVATAISNTASREALVRLADEQAALRRVATLVAQALPPSDLFGAVTAEVGTLLGADLAGMLRYESDEMVAPVAAWAAVGKHPDLPARWPTREGEPATLVAQTRRPARIDDWDDAPGPIAAFVRDELGIRSSVGSPIFVEGRLWGALAVHSTRAEPLPADTALRLENFTELVGTAVANAQARGEVARLADEQAALRRVATLVAREAPPEEVFAAVAAEAGRLLPVEDTAMLRYEDDETATVVASWGKRGDHLELGTRMQVGGENLTALVRRTGRPARMDDYATATGAIGTHLRSLGIRSAVGCPIVVHGRLWGIMIAAQGMAEPLPTGTEWRIGKFTELVATAISNVQARSDLAASRARIVAATDEERRRVVRDLHDGAQQRLVHTIVTLKFGLKALQANQEDGPALVAEALDHAQHATAELRELSHGILPTVLTRGGLREAVRALASRTPVPVEVTVTEDRLPAAVEGTAYFVVAESLTNVAKHARATAATVQARVEDGTLQLQVRDDGAGGAHPEGSGLVGLADRLAALDGQLRVESPPGGGTLVAADIPLPSP
jgi:PAS domain S-box-containing protein